jgi:hypothetical protein
MRQNLCVGLGFEPVSLRAKAMLQIEVVLNNAVMRDIEPARTIAMRMRIRLAWPTVCCPARVTNAAFH